MIGWLALAMALPLPAVPMEQSAQDWIPAWHHAGLDARSDADVSFRIVDQGAQWQLQLLQRGVVQRAVQVEPAASDTDREDIAFLAAGLLRTILVDAPPAGTLPTPTRASAPPPLPPPPALPTPAPQPLEAAVEPLARPPEQAPERVSATDVQAVPMPNQAPGRVAQEHATPAPPPPEAEPAPEADVGTDTTGLSGSSTDTKARPARIRSAPLDAPGATALKPQREKGLELAPLGISVGLNAQLRENAGSRFALLVPMLRTPWGAVELELAYLPLRGVGGGEVQQVDVAGLVQLRKGLVYAAPVGGVAYRLYAFQGLPVTNLATPWIGAQVGLQLGPARLGAGVVTDVGRTQILYADQRLVPLSPLAFRAQLGWELRTSRDPFVERSTFQDRTEDAQ